MAKENENVNELEVDELNSENGVEKLLKAAEKKQAAKPGGKSGITIENENGEEYSIGSADTTALKKKPVQQSSEEEDDESQEEETSEGKNEEQNEEETSEESEDDDEDEQTESEVESELELSEEEQEIESSWINAGKELGFEVKEENFESFQEGLATKLQSERNAGIEEGKKIAITANLKKLPEDAQAVISLINDGVPVDELLASTSKWDKILAQSDEALYKQWLTQVDKKTPEKADAIIAKKIAEEEFDDQVADIRSRVEDMRANDITTMHSKFKAKRDAIIAENASIKKQETERLEVALRKITTFNGQKISQKSTDQIVAKMKAGIYRERFAKDENFTAQMIVQSEFGEKSTKKLVDKAVKKTVEDSKESLKKKLFNEQQIGSSKTNKTSKGSSGSKGESFGNWGNMIGTGKFTAEEGN